MEYTYQISSLSATQFTVEKSNSVQGFAMIDKNCFLVQLQTLHDISHRKTVLETLTRELNALT